MEHDGVRGVERAERGCVRGLASRLVKYHLHLDLPAAPDDKMDQDWGGMK